MATDISALFPGITTSASSVDNDPDFYFRKMVENLNKLTPLTGDELERVLNEDEPDLRFPGNRETPVERIIDAG